MSLVAELDTQYPKINDNEFLYRYLQRLGSKGYKEFTAIVDQNDVNNPTYTVLVDEIGITSIGIDELNPTDSSYIINSLGKFTENKTIPLIINPSIYAPDEYLAFVNIKLNDINRVALYGIGEVNGLYGTVISIRVYE